MAPRADRPVPKPRSSSPVGTLKPPLMARAEGFALEVAPFQRHRGIEQPAAGMTALGVPDGLAQVGRAELQVDILPQAIAELGCRLQLAHRRAPGMAPGLVEQQFELVVARSLRAGVLGEQGMGGTGGGRETRCQQGDEGPACWVRRRQGANCKDGCCRRPDRERWRSRVLRRAAAWACSRSARSLPWLSRRASSPRRSASA